MRIEIKIFIFIFIITLLVPRELNITVKLILNLTPSSISFQILGLLCVPSHQASSTCFWTETSITAVWATQLFFTEAWNDSYCVVGWVWRWKSLTGFVLVCSCCRNTSLRLGNSNPLKKMYFSKVWSVGSPTPRHWQTLDLATAAFYF